MQTIHDLSALPVLPCSLALLQRLPALLRCAGSCTVMMTENHSHLEWWRAYYHFVRPHASLRVALVQPRERGGKRAAQRYQQRTPAMAAGRTTHRWTAREVLACPLPKVFA